MQKYGMTTYIVSGLALGVVVGHILHITLPDAGATAKRAAEAGLENRYYTRP